MKSMIYTVLCLRVPAEVNGTDEDDYIYDVNPLENHLHGTHAPVRYIGSEPLPEKTVKKLALMDQSTPDGRGADLVMDGWYFLEDGGSYGCGSNEYYKLERMLCSLNGHRFERRF